jgi:hypothetical protein
MTMSEMRRGLARSVVSTPIAAASHRLQPPQCAATRGRPWLAECWRLFYLRSRVSAARRSFNRCTGALFEGAAVPKRWHEPGALENDLHRSKRKCHRDQELPRRQHHLRIVTWASGVQNALRGGTVELTAAGRRPRGVRFWGALRALESEDGGVQTGELPLSSTRESVEGAGKSVALF